MSFSSEVKEELSRKVPTGRHCQIAELAAILGFLGRVKVLEDGGYSIKFHTENEYAARKCFTLLKKAFNIETDPIMEQKQRENAYTVVIEAGKTSERILQAIRQDTSGAGEQELLHSGIVQRVCCRRAYIRGAFLSSGSISDPNRFYHFEIVCDKADAAEELKKLIGTFEIDARIVERKNHYVVYVKEGSQIVDLLGIMEASTALMNLENVRILKEMRGSVNRKVNCETANLNKTVNAAVRQIEEIRYLERTIGFEALPENLRQIARMRILYPELSLAELGKMVTPAIGKSGVNHRLRKLISIAEDLKGKQGGELL